MDPSQLGLWQEWVPHKGVTLVPLQKASTYLETLIRRVQAGDPLAPVTVAGPSNYANLSLRHELGRRGFANVRYMVVARLAELLGAPALTAQGKRPLSAVLESAAVRAVAQEARGPLEGLRDHPMLHRSLRATFRDLRRASPQAVERAAAHGPLQAEVARLYRLWTERTQDFYDREELAWSAARAVADGPPAALRDLGAVVFHLPAGLSPGERALAEALMRRAECHAVLGLTDDPQADEGVLELAHALGWYGDAPALGEPRGERGMDVASTHILVAPSPREEMAWVLRQVMQAAERGTPLHRMAVLYRQISPYARLVREQCELAGIPTAGPGVATLGDTAAGRTLAGLLALADGDLARDELMAWLTACPVASPEGARRDFHPSQWDALSRAAGVVRGEDQWRERLEQYALDLERRVGDKEQQERRSEAGLERMRREAQEARALASFVARLAEDLRLPPEGATWQDHTDWALDLLERYFAKDHSLPEDEQDAYERVREALHELPGVAVVDAAAAFDAFHSQVEEALASSTGHAGRTGEGLFVAPFALARGMEFDSVHLVGMVEGAVPPRVADDPLVPDQARRAAPEGAAGIPLRGARARDERYAYLAALASAPERTLSHPTGDPASLRKQFPSRWLLEQASVLEGQRVFSNGLDRLGQRPWLTRVASRQEGLRSAELAAPMDVHDRDLLSLLNWREAGRRLEAHHLAAGTHLRQAVAMGRARALSALSAWDGDASALAGSSRRLRPEGTQVLSPSRLQAWAKCPFSYFLSNVLHISALETPEDTEVITPLEKGTLVHGVLERFVREAIERGAPRPGEEWSADDRTRLHALAHEAFREVEARGLTGRPLLWGLERDGMVDDLDEFLRQDSIMRAELGSTPWDVEMRFGFEDDGPELEGAVALAFRGVIDRVDRTADGGALVLDYKTGRSDFGYKGLETDPVDRGRLLQLPVYGLAVRGKLGDDVAVRAAYWFVTTKGGFAKRPGQPLALEDGMPALQRAVGVITSGIATGYFPANPGPGKENCTFCDFHRLCPGRREAAWERKRRDPRLASYVELAGENGEEEAGA